MGIFPEKLIDTVRRRLAAEAVLEKINYRTEMIQDTGGALKCFCPIHKEAIFRTLLIDKKTGNYRCSNFNCAGNAGGDLIDLYARAAGLSYEQAIVELAGAFGIDVDLSAAEQYLKESLEVASNFLDLGALREAEEQYDQIMRFREDCESALRGLLRIYEATERWEAHDATRLKLARALAVAHNYQEALELVEASLGGHPGDTGLKRFHIDCLEGDGQLARAAQETLQLGDTLAAGGEIDRALEVYRSAAAFDGAEGAVGGKIVALLGAAGRREEAVAESLTQADRRLTAADSEGAAELLLDALELEPGRESLTLRLAGIVADYHLNGDLLAQTCEQVRKLLAVREHAAAAQAVAALERTWSEHASIKALRAELEESRGNHDRALDLFLECADQYTTQRDPARALAIVDRMLAGHPGNVALLSRKANLLRQRGETDEAIAVYLEITELFKHADELDHAAAVYQTVIDMAPDRFEYRERQFELYLAIGLEPVIERKGLELAAAFRARRDSVRAMRVLTRALKRAPQSSALSICHGEILEESGRRAEAAELFLAGARLLLEQQQSEPARGAITRALRCVPEHLEAREVHADVLIAQGSALQAVSIYSDLAEFYLREKDAEALLRNVRKILAVQGENMPALLMLARGYGLAGDPERQLSAQAQLIHLYMNNQSWTRATEICEEILGRHEDYAPALEQLVAIAQASRQSGRSVKYLWKLSQVHARAGRRDHEQAVLEQVLQADPLHVSANYRNLELLAQWAAPQALAEAISLFVQRHELGGALDQAIGLLQDLARDPMPKPEVYGGLARLFRSKGDVERLRGALRTQAELLGRLLRDSEALEVWNELARLAPDDHTILRVRIELLLRNNLMNEVAEEYRRLAGALLERRRFEEAEIALLEVLGINPGDLPARDELISILIRTRENERAAEQIDEAAGRLMEDGRYAEAIKMFERTFEFDAARDDIHRKIVAIRQRMGDPQGMLDGYGQLLDCLEKKDSGAEFEQCAQEAIKLYPDSAALRQRLATFYAYRNRPREAEGVLLTLAVRQIEATQIDDAERSLERILELNPNSVPARAHHAQILARKGQTQEALNEFINLTGALALNQVMSSPMSAGMSPLGFSEGNYEGIRLIRDYTFETFVAGARNNFALATAQAVSRAPSKNYNPLFLYSDVGLGKTHLCHAIAHTVVDRHPEMKVLYTTTEEFVAELIDAIQNNTMTAFRNHHKLSDVLIIDDVQFLSGKERAQEEFFNVFNALYQAGKQVVLTSDRPPKDITHLEKRLRSRFGAGIIVDIQPPDLETRIAILRHELKARDRDGALGDEILLCVAENVESNVRELKGMLNQLLARQDFSGQKVDVQLTEQLISHHLAVDA